MTGATTDDDPLVAMIAALSAETTVLIDNHRLAVSSGDRLLIDRAKYALRDHLARMDAALNIIKTRLELRRNDDDRRAVTRIKIMLA